MLITPDVLVVAMNQPCLDPSLEPKHMSHSIYLREVARALEAHLNSSEVAEKHATNAHWINVIGEVP